LPAIRRLKPNGRWAVTIWLRSVDAVAKLGKLYWCTRCRQRHYRKSGIGKDHWQYRRTWYGPLVSMARSYQATRAAKPKKVRPTVVRTSRPPPQPRIPTPRQEFEATAPTPPRHRPAGDELPWKSTIARAQDSIAEGRKVARRRLRAKMPGAAEAAIQYVFDEDGFYEGIADKLIEGLPSKRRATRGHDLCKLLNAAGTLVDSGTYEKIAGETVEKGLTRLGVDKLVARAFASGSKLLVKSAFDASSIANLSKAFRVTIPLVCPDLTRCPSEAEVLKTYATPFLSEELKAIAEALSAPQRPG
jgi:hypothetical protein